MSEPQQKPSSDPMLSNPFGEYMDACSTVLEPIRGEQSLVALGASVTEKRSDLAWGVLTGQKVTGIVADCSGRVCGKDCGKCKTDHFDIEALKRGRFAQEFIAAGGAIVLDGIPLSVVFLSHKSPCPQSWSMSFEVRQAGDDVLGFSERLCQLAVQRTQEYIPKPWITQG
jgi:hypothetical protein